MREIPRKCELQAVKRQRRWIYLSYSCIALLFAGLLRNNPVPLLAFFVLCVFAISVLARLFLAFADGFFVMTGFTGTYVVRGSRGIARAFVQVVAEAGVGVLFMIAINS